jgi:hypothetical protein
MSTFKDEYLSKFPSESGSKSVRESNGDHWTHEASLIEGDLKEVSPGNFEVISESYGYRRFDYGHPNSIVNWKKKGEHLLSKDCEEKDSYGF